MIAVCALEQRAEMVAEIERRGGREMTAGRGRREPGHLSQSRSPSGRHRAVAD